LNLFEKLFSKSNVSTENQTDTNHTLQLATCILLIEVSKSDDDFDTDEQEKIKKLIQAKFDLNIEELNYIYSLSNDNHKNMTSLFEWTDIINKECSYEEKLIIIGYMWDIAFTDSKIDKYEDYTIRKVSELIYVKHKDFINLKNKRVT
tara:strand:- start:101 stop:544 length:444 start_codon:yes stop_codon:yes gene_type:complete